MLPMLRTTALNYRFSGQAKLEPNRNLKKFITNFIYISVH